MSYLLTDYPSYTNGIFSNLNNNYGYILFNSNGTFTINKNILCDILVVGGGGGGGINIGSGGGAGGVVYITNYSLTSGTYSIIVGNGGSPMQSAADASTANGGNSIIRDSNNNDIITALGGAIGSSQSSTFNGIAPKNGGSGAGGTRNGTTGGSGIQKTSGTISAISRTNGYGNAGGNGTNTAPWPCGGGGGAGGIGGNGSGTIAGNGGIGIQINITGTNTYYAGGGGGGAYKDGTYNNTSAGTGGLGGGGNGSLGSESAISGLANTGGGGGGGGNAANIGGAGGSGVIIIKFPFENSIANSNFSSNLISINDKNIDFPYFNDINQKPSFCNICFSANYNDIVTNKPNLNPLSTSSNLYYTSNSFNTSFSNINYITSNNIINFNKNKLNSLNSSLWINSGLNIYSNLGSIGIGTSSFGNNKLIIKGNLKTDELNLKGNNISNIFITSNRFDNKSNSIYISFSNQDYISRTKQLTSSQFTTDSNKNLFINYLSNFSYYSNSFTSASLSSNSLSIPIKSQITFNYSNQYFINPGIYNVLFDNGNIITNYNSPITDKSYPILKNTSGVNINPTAWYKFDDITNIGLDSSGNGNHLTNNGSVSLNNTNIIKGTYSSLFNGANNLQIAYTGNLFSDQSGWSLSFWVYLRKPSNLVSLISTRLNDSSTLRGFNWYFDNSGNFGFQVGNDLSYSWYGYTYGVSGFYTDSTNFKWFHLVLTMKSGEQRFYSNGVLLSSGSESQIPNFQNGSSTFTIGSSSQGNYYVENGFRYDDVRYYGGGIILTLAQVQELYNGRIDLLQQGISYGINTYITGTGNTINTTNDNSNYRYALFISNGTFVIDTNITCDILVVGGGGGGGIGGGGGGAGAVLYTTNFNLSSGTYSIVVGSGGAGSTGTSTNGTNGNNSSITINSIAYTAVGGGGGGTRNDPASYTGRAGNNGGSGGGGSHSDNSTIVNTGGSSSKNTYVNWTSLGNAGGEGKDGYANGYGSGGGGGAGSMGTNAGTNSGGNGGSGVNLSSIFGTNVGQSGWFGGGGGGGSWTGVGGQVGYGNGGNGLLGGGGNAYGGSGIAYTGGGGGGGDFGTSSSGTGGSGVVIIRYLYSSSTIISNSNSLVLSSNSIVKFNYSNDTNINIGTYNVSFSSGSIFINSNFINDKSYPILKDISGNNINPIAWYKFDDTTNLGKDDTNTYNLINNNSVSYNSTNFVKGTGCSYFNGTNKSLTNSNAFNLNSKDFSISCWLYTTLNNSYNFFLCIGSSTATRTRVLLGYFNNNTYIFSFSADDLYSPVYTEDLNKWVHICATYKTGTRIRKIYRNGIEVASGTSGGETNSTTSFFLGKIHDDTSFYNGNIDDFRIYDKELTPNQIQELYKGRVDFYSSIKISSNIGIGTSLIGNDIITIAGNLNVNDFKIKNNSSSNFLITSNVLSNSSNNIINVFNSRYSTFNSYNWINSNSSIYLSSNGNIGIGSTNPKEKLDIFGNLNINGKILPNSCNSFDIGSSNRKFKELYLSGNSIYLDNTSIKNSNNYLSSSNININQITIRNNTNGINKTISLNSNGDFMINNKFLLGIDNRLQLSNIVFSNVFSNSFNNISNLNNSKFNSINSTDLITIGSCNRFITNDIYNRPATFTGTIQSYNLITSNLNITGDTTTFNTTIYQTEQLFIANTCNYPAMILKQININKNVAEFYTSNLQNINVSISGTGNTINTANDNINYKYAFFANNGTFTIDKNISCDILVVGGGGGGGAGGGGAGGFVYRTNQILSAGTYNINIGAGGSGGTNGNRGNDGNDTYIQLNSTDILRAYKGGGGGTNGQLATAPTGYYGSTGGCGHDSGGTQNIFPAGTLIGGNIGGVSSASPSGWGGYQSSGGGGGAGGIGQVGVPGNGNNGNYGALGGAGGIGIQNSIIGIPTYYAGGGGGGTNINSTSNSQTIRPQGGLGGGGNGNLIDRQGGTDGIANTGGGGGGSDWEFTSISGSGGSGVVIIRYLLINSTNQIRFVVNSNGNVGIGTINPISKLNVIGNINSTGLIINNNEITNVIKTNDSNYSNSVINNWNYSNNLYLSSSNSFLNISNSKQDLFKSPSILLGIGSNISNLNYSNFINRPDLSIYSSSVNSTSNLLYSNLSNIELNSSNTNISYINTNINNLVKFQWITNGNNVYTNSNVGIGSTIPTMSLDINGNLNTNELLIKKGNISNVFITSNVFEDRSNNYYSSFTNRDLISSNTNIAYINNVVNTNLTNLLNNADIWKNGTNYTLSIDYITSITNNLNSLELTNNSIATFNYSNSYNINPASYDFNFYNGIINTSERPLIKPWGAYFANDWSGTTLLDSSGNGRHATTSGTITKTTASGNGAYGAITYISGGKTSVINWPSGSIPANFTILGLQRYTNASTNQGRILSSSSGNWLLGTNVSTDGDGVAFFEGWKTAQTNFLTNKTDWLCIIGKNGGAIPNNIIANGVGRGNATGGSGGGTFKLTINNDVYGSLTSGDWALSAVIIYDTQLTDANMFKLNSFIENYKITGNLSLLKSNIFGITDNYYPILKDVNGTDIIPTAWYKFDDTTNLGIDSSSNGYNLTNYNSVGYNTNFNVYGTGSSSFNSANSRYLLGSAPNINGVSFSISFWVYPTSTNDTYIYSKDNYQAVRGALHIGYRNSTNFTFAFYGDDLEVAVANHDNKWNFFTCTYNVSNNQQIVYVNGVLTASRTSGGSLNAPNQTYNIGRNFVGGSYFNGYIDDFRIYSGLVLTQSQITQLFTRFIDKSYQILKDTSGNNINPIAWYKFDDINNSGKDDMNNYNLTPVNTPVINTTNLIKGVGCISIFRANSQYLTLNNLNFTNLSFSICLWSYLLSYESSGETPFFAKGDNTNSVSQALFCQYTSGTTGTIQFGFYGNDMTGGNYPNDTNIWINWVFTYDKDTKKRIIYRNGVNVAEGIASASYTPTTHNYRIGGLYLNNTQKYFNGYIDDFRIYTGLVLTQAQITQLYNRFIDKSYPILKDTSGNNINPIVWYKLDNNFLTTDSSGNNNNLVNVGTGGTINTTTFVKGDGSAYFNNTANYFRNTSIINYNVPISFSFWFNCGTANNNTMVSYNDNLGNPVIQFDYTGNILIVYTALNTTWTTSPQSSTLNLNTWYHVVYTLNNNNPVNANLYINGSLVSTANGNANQTLKTNRGYVYLGYSGDNLRGFNGYLDDFRFYNFSLSSTQVLELYKGRVDIYSSNLSSNILINSNVSFLDNAFSFGAGSYNNTLVSTNNSLVLSQNYIAKINYNNDINIIPGTYKAVFNNGTISFDETSYVRPWGAYFANDWSGTTLLDSSGNGRHATTSSGNITKITGSGNGASGLITYIYGGTSATISWPSGSIPANFTILSLSRYTGGTRGRILTSDMNINLLHGHHDNKRGVAYYDGWKTNVASVGNLDDWVCCIGKNGGTNPNNILIDGVASGTATGGTGSSILYVNLGRESNERSDWALCAVVIFDSHLSDAYMVKLNNFINTYKTTGNLTELKSNILGINDKSYPVIKERQYPPKLYNSASVETTTTEILGKTTYKQTLTLNTTGISYGSGDYIIYSSSVFTSGDQSLYRKADLFNFNTGDIGGHWDSNYSTSTGYYTLSNFIKSGYIGDWIIIKLPVSIILTKFRFYHRTSYLSQAPSLWKCYGSIDGINFNEIVEASNDTISLTSSNYDSNRMYEKTLSASFNTFYNYIGFTFNRKINDPSQAYFCFAELQLFGRETIDFINNPIVWYKFDDNSNNMILESSLNTNYNLTLLNNPTFDNTNFVKGNGSIFFNNSSTGSIQKYAVIPNTILPASYLNSLNIANGLSFSFWIKLSSSCIDYNRVLYFGNFQVGSPYYDNTNYRLQIRTSSPKTTAIYFDIIKDGFYTFQYNANIYDDTWKHIVWTISSIGIWNIYINNSLVCNNQSKIVFPLLSSTNLIYLLGIDKHPTNYGIIGNFDDFRIYNFELSPNQVQELYTGRIDFYNVNSNNDILNTNLLYSQILNSTPNTLTLTSNSLVLSGSTLARFNYTNEVNINPGTYDINLNGGIGIGESPYVRPWGAYFADDWSGTTLLDSSGNSRHATTSSGNITKTTGSGNGATGNITYIYGGTSSTISWPNGSIPANFTILSLTRYNGSTKKRILDSSTINWLHGHWGYSDYSGGGRGRIYYNTWLTENSSTPFGNLDDWLCCIGKNGGTNPNNILLDGTPRGIGTGGTGNSTLRINGNGEPSDWALSAVIIYDSHLSDAHMVKLNNFINTYKTTGNLADLKSNILRITNNSYPILKDRQYPPKLYDSVSAETTTTEILGKTTYKQTFTLNTTGISYGSGDYIIYSSSTYFNVILKNLLFDYNLNNSEGAGFNPLYTSGIYNSTNFIVSDYLGDWIIIKLPISIILTRFSFQERSGLTSRAPAEWKCYGSINGTNWIEITQASQMTRLSASNYVNGFYTKSFFNSTPYLYIGFTINKVVGGANDNMINFNELQLFGKETNDFINNPTLWYKFDDSSNIGLDSSGNGYHLTNNNSVGYNSVNKSKGTGSCSFNGVNQYLSSSTFSTNISQKSFSISYFQYAFSTTNGSTLYFGSEQYWLGYGVNYPGTYGFGGWSFGDIYSSAYNTDINNWIHVCFTYNVSTQSKKIYRNGVLIASATGLTIYNITNNTFYIGSIAGAYFMNGLIDDFRLYNGMELSQSQILELYQGRVELYNYVITSNYSSNLLIKGDLNIKGNIKLNNTSLNLTSSNVNVSITGTGNTINTTTDNLYYNYAYFANTGTFTIDKNMICDILMVGGGGGGGYNHAGGGGAGAYYYGSLTLNSGTYNINIGAGGNGGTNTGIAPQNGGDTFISSNSIDLTINGSNVRCKGGGGAGMYNANGFIGNNGGCGGGGDGWSGNTGTNSVIAGGLAINTGTIGKGFNGGSGRQFYNSQELAGGGGGGIGGAGGNVTGKEGGAGGNALAINITGSQLVFGGGGGGGEWPAYTADPAGIGGSATLIDGKIVKVGGDAVRNEGGSGGNGTTNTGSGGGAGKGGNGGNGGSGVVIIRYSINQFNYNGVINYSNIQNRPYMLDLLTSSNIINIGEEKNINFPLSLTSWNNEWNLYIGNSPTNIPNSFIFHHLTNTFTTNVTASGGVINTASDDSNFKYAIFTGNGTFTIDKSLNCDILVVGGGGSGGQTIGGGGGGGAVVYIKNIVLSASTYNIVVGAGGAQSSSTAGNKGSNSSFGSIIAEGGGGGVSYGQTFGGGIGGSGGGGGANESGVAIQVGGAKGTASSLAGFTGNIYGNIGGSGLTRSGVYLGGGGGGGAGEAGINGSPNFNGTGGRGGNGILINITGSNLYWGAGGGGAQYNSSDNGVVSRAGNGGLGGGGGGASASGYYGSGGTGGLNAGVTPTSQVGGTGGANTGSGGGAGGWVGAVGGSGGSGVVIIRYSTAGVNSKWWFNGTTTTTKAEISDNRIKREIKDISNGLDMLMLINPKEYYLCDDKDYHKKYGIIAQDLYKIPELNHLVYKDEDYIANVYSFAFYYNSNGKYIISSLNPIIDLININNELKILLDNYNNQEIIIEELTYQNRYKKRFVKVKSIIDNYSFEIFEDIELNEDEKIRLFIYGKKINDFHKLDYNSLYTLNISANQEIYDIINNTYKTLDYLTTKVKTLENKLL